MPGRVHLPAQQYLDTLTPFINTSTLPSARSPPSLHPTSP